MKLTPRSFILFIDQLKRMTTITIHVSVAIWCATVGEQEHHLMRGFRTKTDEVPKHVRILQKMRNRQDTFSSISPE